MDKLVQYYIYVVSSRTSIELLLRRTLVRLAHYASLSLTRSFQISNFKSQIITCAVFVVQFSESAANRYFTQ